MSDSVKGEGGNSRLSGRPSIHNHGSDCPFWHFENMGRYGLSTKRHEETASSALQEGTDEVDNVMSKFARASSPIATRKSYRRNSLSSPSKSQNYTDDSDNDSYLLSRSSPAILSPYSFCSEEEEQANRINYSNESRNSLSPENRLNASENNVRIPNIRNLRNDASDLRQTRSAKKGRINSFLISLIITALVGIIAAYYYNVFHPKQDSSNIVYDKFSFYNDVKGVGNKYKVSVNSILQVRAGIATIVERQDTGSFIFAYNSGRRDFNLEDFNNFVNDLASTAAKYLRNDTKTIQHVVVDVSTLPIQSDKELMNEYIDDVDKSGVMLVKDLDKVPSGVAMAFHYYCDEYNPLVKKSAIFFTLNMAKCSNASSEKYTHENIEKCLAEKWVKMPQDNIRPLLNRVVNVVIDVTSDFLIAS